MQLLINTMIYVLATWFDNIYMTETKDSAFMKPIKTGDGPAAPQKPGIMIVSSIIIRIALPCNITNEIINDGRLLDPLFHGAAHDPAGGPQRRRQTTAAAPTNDFKRRSGCKPHDPRSLRCGLTIVCGPADSDTAPCEHRRNSSK